MDENVNNVNIITESVDSVVVKRNKLKSRKFWICVAAALSSVATSISGIATSNETIVVVGTVCGIVSAAIYAFCEAWVDSKSL